MSRLVALKLLVAVLVLGVSAVATTNSYAHPAPDGFADLAESLLPSVVNIASTFEIKPRLGAQDGGPGVPPWFDPFGMFGGQGRGQQPRETKAGGSGFIIDETGIIITNHHVIDNADKVVVTLSDGTELEAEVLGADARTDIAVLKVDPDGLLPAVKLANSDLVRVGEWVIAVGNPFGLGGTVTAGIVSALGRDIGAGYYDDFIQTDAPINQGNSGGPLFNMAGEVIGINSVIISRGGGNVGIGFSIPSNLAQRVVADLREHGRVQRGWLGVGIQSVDEEIAASLGLDEAEGVMISNVMEGYPAEEAGVLSGDVILKFDDKDTPDTRTLLRAVSDTPAGQEVDMVVWRDGDTKTLQVTVGEMPDDIDEPSSVASNGKSDLEDDTLDALGMMIITMTDEMRSRFNIPDEASGVIVAQVRRSSDAATKGLRRGDLIVRIGGQAVEDLDDISQGIEKAKADDKLAVLIQINRGGNFRFVPIKLDDEEAEEPEE
ncbi:MAG: Do family serine endopeptidase [Alphaproteobacteria bacterium]|nr:MAG: Do family serine endopeptidase [Alphaproteobacteria bacterium]